MRSTSGTCRALVGALLATASVALQSQPVYRCGNTYSQTPCANAIVVRADDLRTPEQKAQTDAATLQAARLAERLEQDRLARENRSAAGAGRTARVKPGQQSTPMQSTAGPSRADAGAKARAPAKARTSAKTRPEPTDHFIATARQDAKKKPATSSPSRD